MGGSGGFRFLWLLGGELDELEDELGRLEDELERVLGWQGRFHPNRPRPRNGRGWTAFRFVLPGVGRRMKGGETGRGGGGLLGVKLELELDARRRNTAADYTG